MNMKEIQAFQKEHEGAESSVEPAVVDTGRDYELILQALRMDEDTGYFYTYQELVVDTESKQRDLKTVKEEWVEKVCSLEEEE